MLALVLGVASPACAQISLPGLWQPEKGDSKPKGYELAPIVKDGKPSPVLLVPVIQATEDLNSIAKMVRSGSTAEWEGAYKMLAAQPFNPPLELKRILNAYTDNIYFQDGTRRNMYLDGSAMLGMGQSTFGFGTLSVGNGGASPETKDTMTYLYRNEVLNNVDALTAELKYLIAQRAKGVEEGTDDLYKYLEAAQAGFNNYLSTIPQRELKAAEEYVRMKAVR